MPPLRTTHRPQLPLTRVLMTMTRGPLRVHPLPAWPRSVTIRGARGTRGNTGRAKQGRRGPICREGSGCTRLAMPESKPIPRATHSGDLSSASDFPLQPQPTSQRPVLCPLSQAPRRPLAAPIVSTASQLPVLAHRSLGRVAWHVRWTPSAPPASPLPPPPPTTTPAQGAASSSWGLPSPPMPRPKRCRSSSAVGASGCPPPLPGQPLGQAPLGSCLRWVPSVMLRFGRTGRLQGGEGLHEG